MDSLTPVTLNGRTSLLLELSLTYVKKTFSMKAGEFESLVTVFGSFQEYLWNSGKKILQNLSALLVVKQPQTRLGYNSHVILINPQKESLLHNCMI